MTLPMSSRPAGSSDSASKDQVDLSREGRNGSSKTGTKDEHGTLEISDRKSNKTQLSTTAPEHPDGTKVMSEPSMATRLGASASGLMSDVLGSSSAKGFLPGPLAGTTDGSKAQSSSSTSGLSESSTAVQSGKNRPDAGVGSSHAPIQPESFRSSPTAMRRTEKGAQYEFDEFIDNSNGPLMADYGRAELYNGQSDSHTKNDRISGSAANALTGDDQIPTMGTRSATFASHAGDGAAVVSLLSDPEFSVDDPSAYRDMYDPEVAATDPLVSRLTPQQLDLLTRIKAQLPQPPIHRAPAPTNPLNLLPNFQQSSGDTNGRSRGNDTNTLRTEESYTYLSPDATTTRPYGEASGSRSSDGVGAHLSQWFDVLNRYQDEVWGDLLPLVQDVRKEIEQAKNSNADEVHEGPATRRLAMVFAHLKASPASVIPVP